MTLDELVENLVFSASYIGGGDRFLTVHMDARRSLAERYGYEELRQLTRFIPFRVMSNKLRAAIERDAERLVTGSLKLEMQLGLPR